MTIVPGSKVKFLAHGETGLPYTVVTIEGRDCQLHDQRNRVLARVPIELLVLVPEETQVEVTGTAHLKDPARCWREVDELEAL